MYILTTIEDEIPIYFDELQRDNYQVIVDRINQNYSNKLIRNVGLGIVFWDMLECSEGIIPQGKSQMDMTVKFRLVVFSPFEGEVIEGRISNATNKGIRITLEFFDEIIVPYENLHQPIRWNSAEKVWVWKPTDKESYYFDRGEEVRFKVEQAVWSDVAPAAQAEEEASALVARAHAGRGTQLGPAAAREKRELLVEAARRKRDAEGRSVFTLVGSMMGPGLGVVRWWQDPEEEDGEAEGEAVVEVEKEV